MTTQTTKQIKNRIVPAALCTLGMLMSLGAKADDANFATNINQLAVGAAQVDLISLVVNVPVGQVRELTITHSFECTVGGAGYISWLKANIYVDGILITPTTSDNASCTSNNTAGQDGWVTTSNTVVRAVGGGNHTVLVRGRVIGGGAGRVDDQSLVVVEESPI